MLIDDPAGSSEARSIFANAEQKFQQAIALGSMMALYHSACLYACMNNIPNALIYLERAEQKNALPVVEDILNDTWLDSLRNQPGYRALIGRLMNKKDNSDS